MVKVEVHANAKHLFAPIDALAARPDGMVRALETSRIRAGGMSFGAGNFRMQAFSASRCCIA